MQCPVCSVELLLSERQGVEIDYCPKCRGVWLDRGELDKIIERSAESAIPPAPASAPRGEHRDSGGRRYDDDERRQSDSDYHKKRKRKSFLDDLFDF